MEELPFTSPSERIIGFTVPKAGQFFLCDHDEVWTVEIATDVVASETDHSPYDLAKQRPDFVGWGENKNEVRRAGATEIEYDFNPKSDFVLVRYRTGADSGEIKFPTFSGDWFAASLSEDGKHLVLAEPYGVAVFAVA